jgi:cobalt-zinc-cadmium efflux system membrane fusion protein
MHQLDITLVKPHRFRVYKVAVGQIAFNEDASTVVQTPFTGRVTRVIAKIGDVVKPAPLFEVDSPGRAGAGRLDLGAKRWRRRAWLDDRATAGRADDAAPCRQGDLDARGRAGAQ